MPDSLNTTFALMEKKLMTNLEICVHLQKTTRRETGQGGTRTVLARLLLILAAGGNPRKRGMVSLCLHESQRSPSDPQKHSLSQSSFPLCAVGSIGLPISPLIS